jgi:hypothetical protein
LAKVSKTFKINISFRVVKSGSGANPLKSTPSTVEENRVLERPIDFPTSFRRGKSASNNKRKRHKNKMYEKTHKKKVASQRKLLALSSSNFKTRFKGFFIKNDK